MWEPRGGRRSPQANKKPALKHTAKGRVRREKESREFVPSGAERGLLPEGEVTTSLFAAHAALLSSMLGAVIYHVINKYEVDGRCARVAGIAS